MTQRTTPILRGGERNERKRRGKWRESGVKLQRHTLLALPLPSSFNEPSSREVVGGEELGEGSVCESLAVSVESRVNSCTVYNVDNTNASSGQIRFLTSTKIVPLDLETFWYRWQERRGAQCDRIGLHLHWCPFSVVS